MMGRNELHAWWIKTLLMHSCISVMLLQPIGSLNQALVLKSIPDNMSKIPGRVTACQQLVDKCPSHLTATITMFICVAMKRLTIDGWNDVFETAREIMVLLSPCTPCTPCAWYSLHHARTSIWPQTHACREVYMLLHIFLAFTLVSIKCTHVWSIQWLSITVAAYSDGCYVQVLVWKGLCPWSMRSGPGYWEGTFVHTNSA